MVPPFSFFRDWFGITYHLSEAGVPENENDLQEDTDEDVLELVEEVLRYKQLTKEMLKTLVSSVLKYENHVKGSSSS